jgi:aspartate-semialdehyde dehydrogenase
MYRRDEDGFLLANFRNLKIEVIEPFVFPSQVQQVFYANELNVSWLKVVLHKKARSKCMVVENSEEIRTIDNVIGIEVPLIIPEVLSNTAFIVPLS